MQWFNSRLAGLFNPLKHLQRLQHLQLLQPLQLNMKFNVFAEMKYTARGPGTIILDIHALRTPHQTVVSETFTTDPYIKVEELVSAQAATTPATVSFHSGFAQLAYSIFKVLNG